MGLLITFAMLFGCLTTVWVYVCSCDRKRYCSLLIVNGQKIFKSYEKRLREEGIFYPDEQFTYKIIKKLYNETVWKMYIPIYRKELLRQAEQIFETGKFTEQNLWLCDKLDNEVDYNIPLSRYNCVVWEDKAGIHYLKAEIVNRITKNEIEDIYGGRYIIGED